MARRCGRVRRRRRRGRVHQHHAGDLVGVASGEAEHIQAAEGMAREHIGPWNARAAATCRSVAIWAASWALAAGSLHPRPARS